MPAFKMTANSRVQAMPMLVWPMISTIVIHAIASTINRRSVAEWVMTNYFGSSRISEISIAFECWLNRSRPHCIDLTWAYFIKRVNLAFNTNNHTIFPTSLIGLTFWSMSKKIWNLFIWYSNKTHFKALCFFFLFLNQ